MRLYNACGYIIADAVRVLRPWNCVLRLLLLGASPAHGHVQSTAEEGHSSRHKERQVDFEILIRIFQHIKIFKRLVKIK